LVLVPVSVEGMGMGLRCGKETWPRKVREMEMDGRLEGRGGASDVNKPTVR
jgi:hypothetical protein